MTKTNFFKSYSYCNVLKMSNNIGELAVLANDEVFVRNFEENVRQFPFYQNDLRKIWKEAMQVRDRSKNESNLKSAVDALYIHRKLKKRFFI